MTTQILIMGPVAPLGEDAAQKIFFNSPYVCQGAGRIL